MLLCSKNVSKREGERCAPSSSLLDFYVDCFTKRAGKGWSWWLKLLPGLQRASSATDLYSPPDENTVHRSPRLPVPQLQPAVRLHVHTPSAVALHGLRGPMLGFGIVLHLPI
jgi:hypothetical protein